MILDGDVTFAGTPDLLIIDEAIKLLRLSKSKIYELIHAGKLRAVRPGGTRKWLIPRTAMVELLRNPESPEVNPTRYGGTNRWLSAIESKRETA